MKRTTEEVIGEISKFLKDVGGAHDWDDFISIPIDDDLLNVIRIECSDLRDKYPPHRQSRFCNDEGLRRLEAILNDLKTSLGLPVARS